MAAGDFRNALAVLQDEASLEGLYPATKTELTGKDGGPSFMGDGSKRNGMPLPCPVSWFIGRS
jgi:hypothetical protein